MQGEVEVATTGAASFNDLATFLRPDGSIINLSENGTVEQIQSSKVSSNFFNVLGTTAMLGRTFQLTDLGNGARLAVLSNKFWRERFRSNPSVIGIILRIDDTEFQVIGVMPSGFAFPAKESQSWSPARDTQLWVPIESDPRWPQFRQFRIADAFGVVGRLKAGVSTDQAQAEMTAIASKLGRQYPATDLDLGIRVVPLALYLVSPRLRLTLVLFFAAVLLVLLIACANVAGLFLSRTLSRRKSLAIQSALGARRAHILGRIFAEATVAALGAAAFGVGLATLWVKALLVMAPSDLPDLEQIAVNRYVLLFAMSVSLLSGLRSALVPAVKFSAANLQTELRGIVVSSRDSHRLHQIRVFFECSLAMVLLTATGLLLRSAIRLQHQMIGFRTDHLLSVNLFLHGRKYDDDAQIRAFVDEAIRRVDGIPGVQSAPIGAVFLGRLPNSRLQVEGQGGSNLVLDYLPATWTYVSEDFFKTISIPILRGRSFYRVGWTEFATPVVLRLIGGAMIAIACSRVLAGFLFGISASDPTTYLSVCGLLLAIAALASYIPAHRAIKADPLVSLRFE